MFSLYKISQILGAGAFCNQSLYSYNLSFALFVKYIFILLLFINLMWFLMWFAKRWIRHWHSFRSTTLWRIWKWACAVCVTKFPHQRWTNTLMTSLLTLYYICFNFVTENLQHITFIQTIRLHWFSSEVAPSLITNFLISCSGTKKKKTWAVFSETIFTEYFKHCQIAWINVRIWTGVVSVRNVRRLSRRLGFVKFACLN